MTRARSWSLRPLAVLVGLLLLIVGPGTPSASAAPANMAPSACAQILAEAAQVLAAINAHNATGASVDIYNSAAVAAFNAEADVLNAQRDDLNARASQCQGAETVALEALQSDFQGDYTYRPSVENVNTVTQATAPLNRSLPLPGPTPRGTYQVPNELRPTYQVLRDLSPRRADIASGRLQGQPRPSVGDPDPAYPGRTIPANSNGEPRVSVDHIVPVVEILQMPGFLQLNAQNMLLVVNAPINLQWLSTSANSAKGNREAALIRGASPQWLDEQVTLRDQARTRLQQSIDALIDLQQVAGT